MSGISTPEYLNVLLLEDDEDDKLFFESALEELNIPHQITFARDCYGFFNILYEHNNFDIIFLDLNIPDMDGIECLKRLKENDAFKRIPVIIFTGSKNESAMDETYRYGAHHFIVKPYSRISYKSSLKVIFDVNWKEKQIRPSRDNYVVNLSYS